MNKLKLLPTYSLLLTGTALAGTTGLQATTGTVATTAKNTNKQCSSGVWAKAAIDLMTKRGLFVGYPNGKFNWCSPMTRQEVAVVLSRLLTQIDKNNNSEFNPAEVAILKRGLEDAQKGLDELRGRVDQHDKDIADLRNKDKKLEDALKDLANRPGGKAVPGSQGAQGPQGPQGLRGAPGKDGKNGKDGRDGRDGKDFVPAAPIKGNYIGGAVYNVTQKSVGTMGRLVVGNDSIINGFGMRATADIALRGATPGNSLGGALTYRTTIGRIDGSLGVGGGFNFDKKSTYGELSLGIDYRVFENVALYGEARQNYYFNGNSDNVSSLVAGLKYRF